MPGSHFIDEFNAEQERGSERGLVLVASSMAEELLRRLLMAFMVEGVEQRDFFDGPSSPLSSLSSRISMAHALGLLTERERHVLGDLRKIRNAFAHQLSTSLSDDRFADLLRNRMLEIAPRALQSVGDTPRNNFTVLVILMLSSIEARAIAAARDRRVIATTDTMGSMSSPSQPIA